MRLNTKQIGALSQFFNTVAAAWFAGGAISPLFTGPESKEIIFLSIIVGVALAIVFLGVSIVLLRESK